VLFQYVDDSGETHPISSSDVNDYLRSIAGVPVTAKDFRTWAGTMLAAKELCAMGPAKTQREAQRNMNKAIDAVAKRLGNTRTVCRKYYVHPGLVLAYLKGLTAPLPGTGALPRLARGEAPAPALRRDEVAVLQFLQEDAQDDD
jgi:DNA topoisomerase-1